MEDTSILPDFRTLNTGHASKFNVLWEERGKFLNEDVGVAVDDSCHGKITHLAKAISVMLLTKLRPVVQKVLKFQASNGPDFNFGQRHQPLRALHWPIPYEVYSAATAGNGGILTLMHTMLQQSSAICESMLWNCECCAFVCLNDKHKLKVGEPNCPVRGSSRTRKTSSCVCQSIHHCG